MVAPDIAQVDPYTGRGTMEYCWIEDFVDYRNPTRAELNAGVCLTPNVYDHDGFTVKSSQVDAPNARDRFTPTIAGEQKADDSSIKMYMAKLGADARDLMPEDAEGYIARYPGGDRTGAKVDIYPVVVSAQNKEISLDGSKPDGMQFQYAIKRKPELNIAIPSSLAQVTGLTAPSSASTTVGLSWSAVSGAASYVVQRSVDGGTTWVDVASGAGGAPSGTSTTVTGLTASTTYLFRVAAYSSSAGRGAWSTPVAKSTTA